MKSILITGGTGLVGKNLTKLFQQEGFEVTHLSRKKNKSSIKTFYWNIDTDEMEDIAFKNTDYIVHLAGANVADRRWTKDYKNEIIQSRTKSSEMLFAALERTPNHVKAIISASAIGYYGNRGDDWLTEDALPATDFLGTTCVQWETAVNKIGNLNKRIVLLRTGIVLAKEGGALPPLAKPIRFGIAPIFGNGQQWYPWIHVEDLCRMYLHAILNDSLNGPYNAVAPAPERYKDLMNMLAKVMGKNKINVPVPMPVLQVLMGDFVKTLAMSTRCSADKIVASGFSFQFPELNAALNELLKR